MNFLKSVLIFSLCFCFQYTFSQSCSPDNSYTLGGFYPKDSLPAICKNNDYETVITWVIPKDTFFNNLACQIDSVQLWDVIGLPNGISFSPSNNHFIGGTKGCISIYGNPNQAGHFNLYAVCQWFYHQNTNSLAKIDTVLLPILPVYPTLTSQVIAITDPHCAMHDGTAVLYGYGAFPPFTYTWNNGQVGTVATNLYGGLYCVHIESSIGCTLDRIITLETQGSTINASIQIQNSNCGNEGDGEIEVIPGAGTIPPFKYEWSNGDTTAHITNLESGSYEVMIIDGNLCSTLYTATINSPTDIILSAIVSPDTMLLGIGKIIVQTTGGVAPYQYSWSNGNMTDTNIGLSSGNYTVWVTDSNGCVESQTYSLFSVSLLANDMAIESKPFIIYPNPNEGSFSIKGDISPKDSIAIYDMDMQKIPFIFEHNILECKGLAAGIYIIKIGKSSQFFIVK